MSNVVAFRATSNGLGVALVETAAGATRVPASRRAQLGFHLGRPVRATCRFDGRTHRRLQSRGDIDLVPAGMPGVWEDDRSTAILRISVSTSLLEEAAEALGVHGDRVALAPHYQLRDPQLEHLAWALEAELRSPDVGEWLFGESLALAFAARLVGRYRTAGATSNNASSPRGLSAPQLARVREHVEANLDQRLLLAELAGVAGVSPSHFKTLFKRSTQVPVHQWVMQHRVERARALLQSGTEITLAAQAAGFADASHLARWMRRALGVTPSQVLDRTR